MADNTIILQGAFTSAGEAVELILRSDVDWVKVYNMTELAAANGLAGVEYYWQRGMNANDGMVTVRNAAATAIDMTTSAALGSDGFTVFDGSVFTQTGQRAVTGIDNGTPPTVLTANTTGLNTGDVVRLINVAGAQQLGAMDFTISNVVAGVSFDLAYMQNIVNANPGAGFYRLITSGNNIFYPRRRFITNISNAAQAVVTMSVTHGFTVGQEVRFAVPEVTGLAFGMSEMDGLQGTVVAVGAADVDGFTNTITVDIDTSAFSAFAFPLTADVPFTPALVMPVGEDTGVALSLGADILADSTRNLASLGIILGAGGANNTSPAGADGDTIFWVAGKSFSNTVVGE